MPDAETDREGLRGDPWCVRVRGDADYCHRRSVQQRRLTTTMAVETSRVKGRLCYFTVAITRSEAANSESFAESSRAYCPGVVKVALVRAARGFEKVTWPGPFSIFHSIANS